VLHKESSYWKEKSELNKKIKELIKFSFILF